MLTIDGSFGEGGGQILRTSIALSAITKKPIIINKIRYNRPKPGLAAQHLTGIKAVSELSSADISGVEIGSTELEFQPKELKGGSYRFDIGTAGSITLVLQACIPVALMSEKPTNLELIGGTDVKFAPPMDYFRFIIKPLLERMGGKIEFSEIKRGYYPKGGGRVIVKITPPSDSLQSLNILSRGEFKQVSGAIHYANLPDHIPKRIEASIRSEIKQKLKGIELAVSSEHVPKSLSPGVGVTLWTEAGETILGSSALGERGVPAEKLGKSALSNLASEINSGATVDVHAADQILPYFAIGGGSALVNETLSNHTKTNMEIIKLFYGDIFQLRTKGRLIRIERK